MKVLNSLKAVIFATIVAFLASCQEKETLPTQDFENVKFTLREDVILQEEAKIRVIHNGADDVAWVCMHTTDMERSADELIDEYVSTSLEVLEIIEAHKGANISVPVKGLTVKTRYRFIVKAIDQMTGELYGKAASISFITERDPDVFEINENWKVERSERTTLTTPGTEEEMEYENFICTSSDKEPYIVAPILKSDLKDYYDNDLRAFFEDYVNDFGPEAGNRDWMNIIKTGDCKWQEQRLRSSQNLYSDNDDNSWLIYMIGVDGFGGLTGLYQVQDVKIPQEKATDAYNRWIGTWEVYSNSELAFEIAILPLENNQWYRVLGWESNNIYALDTYDINMDVELFFEKKSGDTYFTSQYVNTMTDNTTAVEYYFTGSFYYANSPMVLGADFLNQKLAKASLTNDDMANVTAMMFNFNALGISGQYYQLMYIFYNGYSSSPSSISLSGGPTLPYTLKRVTGAGN